ncbi:phosphoenolpyruvate phosphomutase-domain-containing protein [Aspergillus ambiguus]|uniref:phosphoenolpyruvate phosphomutase-domain-containing protein n=1 Tax=Aspergillus ambiguus TaxID=176160 RepID=UPI003CCDE9F4
MNARPEQNDLAIYFRSLHQPGQPLLLTNVYDAATASIIAQHPSTKAIATASYAIAASQGVDDNSLTLAQNLSAVRPIAAFLAHTKAFPLTVDIQDGYDDVAGAIREIISLGAVGCNLEDMDNARGQLRPLSEAVSRIKQALQAARAAGVPNFAINARTDVLLTGGSLDDAIERGKAYLEAGACTVFVWGGAGRGISREEIAKLVHAFEGRLNVKLVPRDGFLSVPDLKALGVARISLGPELWRAAMGALKEKAEMIWQSALALTTMGSTAFLPVDNPTRPYWRLDPHPLDEFRSTPGLPEQSDIVIIGAGYTGISTAYHLLKLLGSSDKPYPAITILEARQICSGATGRNGGHLRPDVYNQIPMYIQRHGVEAGREIAEFESRHLQAIKKLLEDEQIDCDFNITRNINVYMNDDDAERGRKTYEALVALGQSFTDDLYFTQKNAEAVSGVKGAKACLSYTAGTLWAYKLIMGLLSTMVDSKEINVQALTPMTSVNSTASGHIVHTPRGSISTLKVVYASNAYTFGLLPEYSASIVPSRGIICHIDVPEGKRAPFLPYSYVIRSEDGKGSSYLISRPDGSIVVGGAHYTFREDKPQWFGVIDDSTLIEPTKDYYHGYMQRIFRGWEDTGAYVKEMWTGIMAYSYDTNPHVGEVPGKRGQYICAGFTGHGMPVIFLATKGLAEMIYSGKKFEQVNLPRLYKTTAERIREAQEGPEGGDILNF